MRIVVGVVLFPVLLVFLIMCMQAWGLAFIPTFISAVGAILTVATKQRRTVHVTIFVLSTVVWFLYAFYERSIPTSDYIRVDIIFVFPILYAVSLAFFFQLMSLVDGAPIDEVTETARFESTTFINHFTRTQAVNYFFWGLARPNEAAIEKAIADAVKDKSGTRAINIKLECKQTFLHLLVSVITIGIYSPRTIKIEGDVVK